VKMVKMGGSACPVYSIFKHHIKAKLIIDKDKIVIINIVNSNKVSKVINFIQEPERH
jgi:hypothetical protein